MEEKSTTDIETMLKSAKLCDFAHIANDNAKEELTLSDFFNSYIGKHNLSIPDIIKESQLNKNYAYNILNGYKTNPTRDRIIALCIAMRMNIQDTQRALKISNAGILYVKNARDMYINMFINNKVFDITQINAKLYEANLDIIHTSKDI